MKKKLTVIFLILLALDITYRLKVYFSGGANTENAVETVGKKPDQIFSLDEICKAGLSTNFGRELKIMNSDVLSEDIIRVGYIRPQDGTSFSYLCRKESNNRLSFFDEKISGARWYGADLADSQIIFIIKNDILTIRDVIDGNLVREDFYTKNNFKN